MARSVYVCMPCYGKPHPASVKQFWSRANDPVGPYANTRRIFDDRGSSLLGNSFDNHWATALNLQAEGEPITHFAMLHSDVVPSDWWLDQLLNDLTEYQADVVSAVIPIKDLKGLTSTAIDDPTDGWDVLRRLTLTEVHRLPEVFGAEDCGYPDNLLLVNTGCWVCDFTKDWRYEVNFEIRNRIVYRTDDGTSHPQSYPRGKYKTAPSSSSSSSSSPSPRGSWVTQVRPEDWEFSRKVGRLGGKVLATRKVSISHMGELPYVNREVWGSYRTDESFRHKNLTHVGTNEPCIRGWLSQDEGMVLEELARDKDVLEIGSYCGLSTVWMARAAKSVTCVDPFDGRGTPRPEDTMMEFLDNLKRHGVSNRVSYLRGTTKESAPLLTQGKFDLAFLDGSHDEESVWTDYRVACQKLKNTGLVGFHDYGSEVGVTSVVDKLEAGGCRRLLKVGSLAVLLPVRKE
jgi:hypothetical protein